MIAEPIVKKLLQVAMGGTILKDIEFNNSPYSHPLHHGGLESRLSGTYDIQLAEDFFVHTKESHISHFLNDTKKYFLNTPFIPNEDYFLNDVYVEPDHESSNIVKIKTAVETVVSSDRPVVVLGERGSGKTASMLVYLYRHHEHLEASNIIWLRCDVHKLYEAWIKAKNIGDNLISLAEYVDLFLSYVICKFANDEKRLDIKGVINKLLDKGNTEFGKYAKASHNHKSYVNLGDEIKLVNESINTYEDSDNKRSYLIDEWVKNAQLKNNEQQRQFKNAKLLADALKKEIEEQDKRVIIFFDGCDNIDINKSQGYELYEKFINELRFFCFKRSSNTINHISLLRPRTYGDLKRQKPLNMQRGEDVKPLEIRLRPACCEEVTKKRFEYILEHKLPQGESREYKSISSAINSMLDSIKEDSDSYKTRLSVNHNVRDFLHNRLSLITILSYVSRVNENVRSSSSRNNSPDLHVNANSWNNRNKFLNGKLYLNSDYDGIETGEPGSIYFNPFCAKPTANRWNGFIYLRIYQIIKRLNTAQESELGYILSFLFEYDKGDISDALEVCETYGLLNFIHQSADQENLKLHIKLNDKFDYFIESTFKDADILYYLALDTYIPISLLNSTFFKCHDNKINRRSYYNDSMPFTTMIFIRFLVIQDENDKQELHDKLSMLIQKQPTLSLDQNDFTLPILQQQSYMQVFNRIANSITHASDESRSNFKTLFGI
jgi:polyhydroxyalkanoate synthesis regulator phasin